MSRTVHAYKFRTRDEKNGADVAVPTTTPRVPVLRGGKDQESTSGQGSGRGRSRFGEILRHGLLLVSSLVMIVPFVWMILGAFKPAAELGRAVPTFFPEMPTLRNFEALFRDHPFGIYFLNSLVVTSITVAFILFTSSLLGYIFARANFRGANVLFALIISAMIIPFEVIVVPLSLIVQDLGLTNTRTALVLPFVIDAFGIYLFREFMRAIPKDYFEAAKIDGASEWRIYRSIALPQCRPVVATLGIFSFVYMWDQLLWPIVVLSSTENKTLPVGIAELSTESGQRFDLTLAAGVLAVIPPLILFLFLQRKIVTGVVMSGLK